MKKRHAFLLSLLVTLLIAGNYLFLNADEIYPQRETVIIGRVIDGDTVELGDGRIIRLLNINTPERGRAGSEEASSFLREFENKTVELEIEGVGRYGRILGRLFSDNYLNLEIVRLGLAHKYLVEDDENKDFTEAEREAIEERIGIWSRSEHYNCLSVEINKKGEYITIIEDCGVNFVGWTIKDESTKQYKFEADWEEEVILYSESGVDKNGEIYWGRGKVWNDDKDSIFMRDEKGLLVYYDSYGY